MATVLTETENELIELYTEKAFQAYQSGKLSEAARCAQRILDFDPEDANALFLKGATIGRASKPGQLYIEQAFAIWKPLVNRLEGEDKTLMIDAISHAFAMMTETPVMLGFRFWSSYYSLGTIQTPAGCAPGAAPAERRPGGRAPGRLDSSPFPGELRDLGVRCGGGRSGCSNQLRGSHSGRLLRYGPRPV